MHLKLDELIRSVQRARNSLVDLEDMSDAELDQLHKEFRRFREGHERAHGREKAAPPHAPDPHE